MKRKRRDNKDDQSVANPDHPHPDVLKRSTQDDSSDDRISKFISWFRENKIWMDEDCIEIRSCETNDSLSASKSQNKDCDNQDHVAAPQFSTGNYGVYAIKDIQPSQQLFHLPFKMVLSTKVAMEEWDIGKQVIKHVPNIHPRSVLLLLLIHLRFGEVVDHSSKNSVERFRGYVSCLPEIYTDPTFWENVEQGKLAMELIQGTNLYHTMDEYILREREDYDKLTEFSKAFPTLLATNLLSMERWKWARSAFVSRCFPPKLLNLDSITISDMPQTDNDKASCGILLPVIDLMNHQYATKVTWLSDRHQQRITFQVDASIKTNEQVFNNYGPKCNEELLLCYGFVPMDNPADSVSVKLDIHSVKPVLSAAGIEHNQGRFFIMKQDPVSLNLYRTVRIMMCDLDIEEDDQGNIVSVEEPEYDEELETNALDMLQNMLTSKVTKMDQVDQKLLDQAAASYSYVIQAARRYRDGQRALLCHAAEWCAKEAEQGFANIQSRLENIFEKKRNCQSV